MSNRIVEIVGKQEHRLAFAAAVGQWIAAERFAVRLAPLTGAARVVVELYPLQQIVGGVLTVVDDRPRTIALMRKHIPAHFVESATVEGRDWNG